MDEDIKPFWLTMGIQRLHRHLRSLKYPEPFIANIMTRVRWLKNEARKARIKTTVTHRLWDDVLKPARTEVGNVRTMKTQTKKALDASFGDDGLQAKFNALTLYESVIVSVVEKLRKVQGANEYAPLQFAEALREAGKMPTNGAGDHWTHYVKPKDRRMVELAFDKAPLPKRGKTKQPFEVKISVEQHDRLYAAMVKRINNEIANAEQEYDMARFPEDRDRLNNLIQDLQRASFNLSRLSLTDPIPAHWRSLLNIGVDFDVGNA